MMTFVLQRCGLGAQASRARLAGPILFLLLCCLLLGGCDRRSENARAEAPNTQSGRFPAEPANHATGVTDTKTPDTQLPVYELKMKPNDLAQLARDGFSNKTYPATFIAGDQVFENVKVRHRGAWARSWPKPPLKIFFDHDHRLENQECLNLNSGWRDASFVRETLAYHVFSVCQAPAPLSKLVCVRMNGQFHGLFVEVEQPDKPLLKRHDLKGAAIYKANSKSNRADERDLGSEQAYAQNYERENNRAEGYGDLHAFCRDLAKAPNAVEFFNQRVDVDRFINFLAANALVQNWDGYNKNHFLIYDAKNSQKWLPVPWDLDRTFGDHWSWSFTEARLPVLLGTQHQPGITGWNRLQDRFLSEPSFKARYLRRLKELLEKEFTPEKLFPLLDRWENELSELAALDRRRWPSSAGDLHSGLRDVKRFIEERRAFLLSEVAKQR